MSYCLKTVFIIPVVAYMVYRQLNSGPFLSMTCSLTGFQCPKSIPVNGFADEQFKDTYDVFLDNIKKGYDIGAGLSVYVDGREVIHLQAGWQDPTKRIEYTDNTLQIVFSSSKAFSSIVVAQLVEKGLLSYDEKIATYWPEFAQGNKENVTLSDLMRHMAGVGALDRPLSLADVKDPAVFSNILASQPHNFGGVPTHAYHAITQGWYLNEIIRRVTDGKTIDDFAREYQTKYGCEWYFKPDATEGVDVNRISTFYERPMIYQLVDLIKIVFSPHRDMTLLRNIFDKQSIFHKSMTNPNIDQVKGIMNNNDPLRRAIEGPSYSGHTNAHSIAKLAAMMANKGKAIVPGEPDLMSEKTFDEATTFISNESDLVFSGFPMCNLKGGLLAIDNSLFLGDMEEESHFEGGFGAGGSLFLYNTKHKIAIGYVTNSYLEHLPPDIRTTRIVRSVLKAVKGTQ
ncbi:Beta-lactamase domain-containing protein 2 [Choanephora cucurbitarum]|uniref:Beta-lactamase domain-containing protein 2 n=1 Tax=Choanephora cucurbitarum TaxID=101091 RepID=A0A1C7NC15_9FUNG|nr:Beta-lactamase domain-containing protein 2 [Choanephora cucurbitarum]